MHAVASIGATGSDELQDCLPAAIGEIRIHGRQVSAAAVKKLSQECR